ncbi:CLUMA_CG006761, isoform A [Clunio marinus]|uniref:CLUMA_CG006761, isoform A n=1 Tax=Clunio marinus TaxID=568069 RepID=A0A1J1I4A8_9DIPT|nr:CLUMA_CG006761, isoform A [Clunio marinus]
MLSRKELYKLCERHVAANKKFLEEYFEELCNNAMNGSAEHRQVFYEAVEEIKNVIQGIKSSPKNPQNRNKNIPRPWFPSSLQRRRSQAKAKVRERSNANGVRRKLDNYFESPEDIRNSLGQSSTTPIKTRRDDDMQAMLNDAFYLSQKIEEEFQSSWHENDPNPENSIDEFVNCFANDESALGNADDIEQELKFQPSSTAISSKKRMRDEDLNLAMIDETFFMSDEDEDEDVDVTEYSNKSDEFTNLYDKHKSALEGSKDFQQDAKFLPASSPVMPKIQEPVHLEEQMKAEEIIKSISKYFRLGFFTNKKMSVTNEITLQPGRYDLCRFIPIVQELDNTQ